MFRNNVLSRYGHGGIIWCGLLFVGLSLQMKGQSGDVDIRGTLRFSSDASPAVYLLSFGVGSDYTDTTDPEFEEFIPPFPPPGGYLMAFERECTVSDGDPPCYFKQDFRGVPEAVNEEGVKLFSISYRLRVRNFTNKGIRLAIRNADWPKGLDSLRIVDAQLAKAFDVTFTGPEVTEISDPQTSWMNVTAYYNLTTASVSGQVAGSEGLLDRLTNPVAGDELHLSTELIQRGGSIVLISPDGRTVLTHSLADGGSSVVLEGVANGLYHLLYVDANGIPGERRSMILIR